MGGQLAQERHPCSCRPSQTLPNMFAEPSLATSVQRMPAAGRLSDHADSYVPPAKEIGLKNNGE